MRPVREKLSFGFKGKQVAAFVLTHGALFLAAERYNIMAASAEITWAQADDDGATIVAIGGTRKSFFGTSQWHLSAEEAIALTEQDEWRFFVENEGEKAWIEIVEDADGAKTISADGAIRTML